MLRTAGEAMLSPITLCQVSDDDARLSKALDGAAAC